MEEFALIKSRVNLNRFNQALALISDIKAFAFVPPSECRYFTVLIIVGYLIPIPVTQDQSLERISR